MAKLTKKEQVKIELEEARKIRNRLAVQKCREKKKNKHQITISLNDIKYDLLTSLHEKLGYPSVEANEKGISEIFGSIIGYLLKYEFDMEPPEKSNSRHIREIYRRHRIALYWQSVDELSDYGIVQKINEMNISNIDYFYKESMGWDVSDEPFEWTVPLYKKALNYSVIKKEYIAPLKTQKTKRKNSIK